MHPKLPISTPRLIIRELAASDSRAIWLNSLDEDNRRFVPDEVFETLEDAQSTVDYLIKAAREDGSYVCPVCLKDGECIGYVQLIPIAEGWEIGYHIAEAHTGRGYATEALAAFLHPAAQAVGQEALYGIVLEENAKSCRVLEKCGFELLYKGASLYQGAERELRRYLWSAPKD